MTHPRSVRSRLRRISFLRNAWGDLRLASLYLRSLPHMARLWTRPRRAVRYSHASTEERHLHVVFITSSARARELKLAHAARLCGDRVTLVSTRPCEGTAAYFDAQHVARDCWEALDLLDELRPDVVHLFANYGIAYLLPVLLAAPVPVVYDPYDCMRGMFAPQYRRSWLDLAAERLCLSRAAHLCARSLEPLYLRRRFGYRLPPTTYFPDYCWGTPHGRAPRVVNEGERLRVVYCGGIWPEDRYAPEEYGYAQFIQLGRTLAKQGIELHLYPAPWPVREPFERFFALYLAEADTNRFFHLHRPLPPEKLRDELAQYDAALFLYGGHSQVMHGRITEAKMHYSAANKLFDYIEAGLVVLLHGGWHQVGLVRHYGVVVIPQDLERLRPVLVSALASGYRANPDACIERHARRLHAMYVDVAADPHLEWKAS